jgi:glycosyltransferase involved in cell wall biosynthesis
MKRPGNNGVNIHRISVILRRLVKKSNCREGKFKASSNENIIYTTYGINPAFPLISSILIGVRAIKDDSELCIFYTVGAAIPFCILNKIVRNKKKCIINAFILDKKWYKVRLIMRWILSSVDIYIVSSRDEIRYYSEHYSLNACKFKWMPLGISLPRVENKRIRQKRNYIFAGGNSHRDYDIFIKAVKTVGVNAIIVCGNKNYDKIIRDEDDRIKINSWVEHDEFWKTLSNSKYVVIPLAEKDISCGQIVFLSAMALGKVVIVPKVAATVDYVEDGINGFIYEFGNHRSLIKIIEYLEKQPEIIKRVGDEAKKYALKRADAKTYIDKLEDIMINVITDKNIDRHQKIQWGTK